MGLLAKTRKINQLLQSTAGQTVPYQQMTEQLGVVLNANVYLFDSAGKQLGFVERNHELFTPYLQQDKPWIELHRWLMSFRETVSNLYDVEGLQPEAYLTVVPLIGGGTRLGSLLYSRIGEAFSADDLVLIEYGSTVVSMELLRSYTDQMAMDSRKRAMVQMAIDSLSYSEREAVELIFRELEGDEGVLVASRIADREGLTRSVIVNALRKLESAGVISTRSLGMKGTYIKILNDQLLPLLMRGT